MGAMERKRIGVIIRSFEAKALVALKYLVLAQNLQQESFEFEILPEPAEDAFLDRLDSKVPQKRQELESEAKGFIARYKLWLTSDAVAYGLQCDMPHQVVFVTALKFSDRYYLTGEANWAILALGYWERSMAPPSVVEFALTLLSDARIKAQTTSLDYNLTEQNICQRKRQQIIWLRALIGSERRTRAIRLQPSLKARNVLFG
jgi:hypothetical protein